MKLLLKIQLMLLVSAISFFAQGINQQWAIRYNGSANGYDGGVAIKADALGNVYMTGTSYGATTGRDFLTIKYSPDGSNLWIARYNGEANGGDYSNALAIDISGNVYVSGRSDRGAPNSSDFTTIKYNSNGVQQWVAFYNGPASVVDEVLAIVVDNSGNVYVTGHSLGVGSGKDIATVKYGLNGNQLWVARYNGTGNSDDIGNSIALDPSGNVFVAGESIGYNAGFDAILIKYSNDGVQQWVQRYNGPANGGDVLVAVKTDADGFVYTTGYSDQGGTGYDYITMKYNSSGVQQWLVKYNGPGGLCDAATALTLDQNGFVYVTGGSVGTTGLSDTIFATIKYNSDGIQQWVALYPGPNNSVNVARDVAVDGYGNVFVTGSSLYTGSNHIVTIKYNPSGYEQWLMTYCGSVSGNNYSTAIAVDNNGHVYVTGRSYGVDYDAITIKYGPELLNIKPVGNEIPNSYNLKQNYPNPFNPSTNIEFSISIAGFAKMSLYNIQGQEIAVLLNEYLQPNTYSIKWNASNVNSGVYFYTLKVDGFTSTKKMILLK